MTRTDAAARGGFFHEVRTGAWRQSNVVFALIFKEFKTRSEGEAYGGMIWLVLDPLISMVVLAAFWYLARRTQIDGVHVALFLATSMSTFTIVRMCMSNIPSAVRQNRSFYNFQQVKPIDSIIARFILSVLLNLLGEALMFFLLAWFMGLYIKTDHLLEVALLLVLSMILGFGIALVIATFGTMYEIIIKILSFISRPLIFVSAVMHPASELPSIARVAISWNPIAQINEYMRYYALGMKVFPEASIVYPLVLTVIMLFAGFISYYGNRLKLVQRR